MGEQAVAQPAPRDVLVANERAKLTATYVNGLAIATFAVGVLAPLIAAILPRSTESTPPAIPWASVAIALFCLGTSVALHRAAR